MATERYLRVAEFAELSHYKPSTIRKKILQRLLGYRKMGRLVLIPESELARIQGDYRPPVAPREAK